MIPVDQHLQFAIGSAGASDDRSGQDKQSARQLGQIAEIGGFPTSTDELQR
jgi:hypothetical protein